MLVVVAIVLAAVAGWLAMREPPQATAVRGATAQVDAPHVDAIQPAQDHDTTKISTRARVSRAERDALHRRIADALARRAAAPDEERSERPPLADASNRTEGEEDTTRPPIRNRLGDDDGWGDTLVRQLADDFGPLADECIADVRERVPDLAGMVALDITIAADEDIGGVVESASPSAVNEIDDADFLECMRESMLSTVLPAPPGSGRRDVMLSLRLEDGP